MSDPSKLVALWDAASGICIESFPSASNPNERIIHLLVPSDVPPVSLFDPWVMTYSQYNVHDWKVSLYGSALERLRSVVEEADIIATLGDFLPRRRKGLPVSWFSLRVSSFEKDNGPN